MIFFDFFYDFFEVCYFYVKEGFACFVFQQGCFGLFVIVFGEKGYYFGQGYWEFFFLECVVLGKLYIEL